LCNFLIKAVEVKGSHRSEPNGTRKPLTGTAFSVFVYAEEPSDSCFLRFSGAVSVLAGKTTGGSARNLLHLRLSGAAGHIYAALHIAQTSPLGGPLKSA